MTLVFYSFSVQNTFLIIYLAESWEIAKKTEKMDNHRTANESTGSSVQNQADRNSKFVTNGEFLYMNKYMDDVLDQNGETGGLYHMEMRIKEDFPTISARTLALCVDSMARKCLSYVDGNKFFTPMDFTFIHPSLPGGQKMFANTTYTMVLTSFISHELSMLKESIPDFQFDHSLKVRVYCASLYKRYVIGDQNTMLKAIAIAFHNYSAKTRNTVMDEDQQEAAVMNLKDTFKIQETHSLSKISKLMDFQFFVFKKNGEKWIYNQGKSKTLMLIEVDGIFDVHF